MISGASARHPESGSGSILALAIIGSVIAVVGLCTPLYIGVSLKQALDGAADASALAAADVASGIAPGSPCATATGVATANAASVGSCTVDGLVVTVRLERSFWGIPLVSTATAGPPDAVTN